MSDGEADVRAASVRTLAAYRADYAAREPNLARMEFADETQLLTIADGVLEVGVAPLQGAHLGTPPVRKADHGHEKVLWVVCTDSVPSISESGTAGKQLSRGRVAHTNLTGGAAAHCAGELWFRDERSFWLSGGSSRYVPRDERELERVVECFTACGYSVASLGWDKETDGPARFLRGTATWT